MKNDFVGFGYNPKESDNHFYVIIPDEKNEEIQVFERFSWDDEENQKIHRRDILKLKISRYKWSKISLDVTSEFNSRLKTEKKPSGKFMVGGNPIDKLLGKELMVLLWGIENNDPAGIPTAVRNWLGLLPEERWWLYTTTNASTGGINDKKGWRTALRYALCENPVDESNQMSMDQFFGGDLK